MAGTSPAMTSLVCFSAKFSKSSSGLTLRWREWLHDFLECRQRLAARGVGRQRRIACGIVEMRVRLAGEAEHAGNRDVGMADPLAEQIRRRHGGALPLQHVERARDLRLAALDPQLELLLAQRAFVDQAHRLV